MNSIKKWEKNPNKRIVGSFYEQRIQAYLVTQGYLVLQMNYRCKIGEIDIIAKENDYIIFIEVKYRKNNQLGYPREAVNYVKQQKIRKVASYYMLCQYGYEVACRFDVVEVWPHQINHLKNAF